MKNRISGMKRSPARDSIRYQAGSTRNRSLLRRIQPLAVWLLAVVLIGLGGCEKDRFADLEREPADAFSMPRFKSLNHPETCESCEGSGKPYQTLDDFPALRSRILTQLQAAEPESRYYAGILDGSVIRSVNGDITTYTIFWQTVGNTVYKLLVRTNSAGNVAEMGVLRIAPSPSFLSGYFQNTALLKDFVGEIGVVTVGDFLDAKRSGSFKSLGRNKSSIDDCQRLIFVNGGPIGGNGGGGQTGNPFGGEPINRQLDGNTTINGGPILVYSSSGGGCIDIEVTCGCHPRDPGGYGVHPSCDCSNKPNIYRIIPCTTNNTLRGRTTLPGLEPQSQGGKGISGRNKNLWWDCVDLLNGAGLLTDHDLYLLRLRECDRYMAGFEGDVSDGATAEHPDAGFCSVWKPYYDRCLSQLPANETQNRWAALMRRNRAAFNYFVANDGMCRVNGILNQLLNTSDQTINLFVEILQSSDFTDEEKGRLFDPEQIGHVLAYLETISGFKHDWHWWGAQDLTPSKIWEVAGGIKQDLINRYPSQAGVINSQFPCQVLGPAIEDAVLESLGDQVDRNKELTGTTNNCEPDGFFEFQVYDIGNPPRVPLIIEVKGRFSTGDNPVFNYSGQMGQFNCYLDYLQNNTYRGHEIGAHGLYLILPAGITIAQNIIDQCTARNIPLYWSEIVYKNDDPTHVMVGKPVCINIDSINLSGTYFPFLARAFSTNPLRNEFNYDIVPLREKILARSQAFEARISSNSTGPCPED